MPRNTYVYSYRIGHRIGHRSISASFNPRRKAKPENERQPDPLHEPLIRFRYQTKTQVYHA